MLSESSAPPQNTRKRQAQPELEVREQSARVREARSASGRPFEVPSLPGTSLCHWSSRHACKARPVSRPIGALQLSPAGSMVPATLSRAQEALSLSWSPPRGESLPCRDKELETVLAFCRRHLEQATAGSLYVCGCPGTGKTMAVTTAFAILAEEEGRKQGQSGDLAVVSLNCMALGDPYEIFETVAAELQAVRHEPAPTRPLKKRKTARTHRERTVLLLLDEVDSLVKSSKDPRMLERLFQLPHQPETKCILIGISNTMHLVEKHLQKLKSLNCAPQTLVFSAYSQRQILEVIKQRLDAVPSGSLLDLFNPKGLELCAKKIAATSGDMRRALDACLHALNLAHVELLRAPEEDDEVTRLGSQNGAVSPGLSSAANGAADQSLRVEVHHMARSLASSLRAPDFETIRLLPLHQQMILTSLVLASKHQKDPPQQELYNEYCRLHKKFSLAPLSFSEFSTLCQTLRDMGLIRISGARGKPVGKHKVTIGSEEDVAFALQGVRLFRTIFSA